MHYYSALYCAYQLYIQNNAHYFVPHTYLDKCRKLHVRNYKC